MGKKFKADIVSGDSNSSNTSSSSPKSLSGGSISNYDYAKSRQEGTRNELQATLANIRKEQSEAEEKADKTAKGCVGWGMLIIGLCFTPMLIGIPFAIVGALMLLFPKWSYWDK